MPLCRVGWIIWLVQWLCTVGVNVCLVCPDTGNQEKDKDRCYYFISFVCCNFRVRNVTFSILIEHHVAVDMLSSFLFSCCTGSICLPLTLSTHSFSLICFTVVGLLSPLGTVNTSGKDFMVFHYGLGGFFCACACHVRTGRRGKGRLCLPLRNKHPAFPRTGYLNPPTGLAVPQGSPHNSVGLDVAAARRRSVLRVPHMAGHLGRCFPDAALALGSPQMLVFLQGPVRALVLPGTGLTSWPFSLSPRGRSQPVGCPRTRAVLVRARSVEGLCVGLADGATQEVWGSMSRGLVSAPLLCECVKPLQLHRPPLGIWCCGLLPRRRGKGASRSRCVSPASPSPDW